MYVPGHCKLLQSKIKCKQIYIKLVCRLTSNINATFHYLLAICHTVKNGGSEKIVSVVYLSENRKFIWFKTTSTKSNGFLSNVRSFRTEEVILEMWRKLVLNKIKLLFSEICHRMRNIHAEKIVFMPCIFQYESAAEGYFAHFLMIFSNVHLYTNTIWSVA